MKTVVSQQMLPDISGNIVPAFEVMHINTAIRTMIRDNKVHQIENSIAAGRNEGMLTMDSSILGLYKEGLISKETAINYADHPDMMQKHLLLK